MSQLAFSLDVARCTGCFACVVACQDQNDGFGEEVALRQVIVQKPGDSSPALFSFFSMACFHCGDAPCVQICPTGAIRKRDGMGSIEVERDICIGCHSCLSVCPFGAPHFAADGKMVKCDMCASRLEQGLEPACSRVCPTRAIAVIPLEEIARGKAERASKQILKFQSSVDDLIR